jgi:hypothetical protein
LLRTNARLTALPTLRAKHVSAISDFGSPRAPNSEGATEAVRRDRWLKAAQCRDAMLLRSFYARLI